MAANAVPSGTDARSAPALGWRALILAGTAAAASLAGLAIGLTPSPDTVVVRQNLFGTVATFVLAMSYTVVGLILRRNRAENRIGWLLLLYGVAVGVSMLGWTITYVAGLPGGDVALGSTAAWLGSVLTVPVWIYLAVSLVVRFPSGEPGSAFDVRLLRFAAGTSILAAVVAAVRPGPFPIYPSFSNPIASPPPLGALLTAASAASLVVVLVPLAAAAWAMVVRYRRSSVEERAQLRWFAYAAALSIGGAALYVGVGILVAGDNEVLRESTYVLGILGFCSQPIAILQAITRHRLYEIDRIIGRTFAYGALTAILAGLYAASVRLFNALFVATTGQTSEASLVLTTLVLATTFTPIKSRLERWAARRFPPEVKVSTDALPADGTDHPAAAAGVIDLAELDARMETVARRVAREVAHEVLAESRTAGQDTSPVSEVR